MAMDNSYGNSWFSVIKGVLTSVAFSFLATVLFAGILRSFTLPDKIIYPVNQVIKLVSIALGTLVYVKGEKGWLKGGGIGLAFTAFTYLLFSAVGGDFSLSWMIFVELFLAVSVGALCGMISVNVKKD